MNTITFSLGFLLGATSTWFIMRSKIKRAYEVAKTEGNTEIAVLYERLRGNEANLDSAYKKIQENASQIAQLRDDLSSKLKRVAELDATLASEQRATQEKLAILEEAKTRLTDAFKALSAEALKVNNESFLTLAKQKLENYQEGAKTDLESRQKAIADVVTPLKDSLEKVDNKMQEIEKSRIAAYSQITEQIIALSNTQNQLRSETSNLVKALRTPQGRGRWGEMQLRRVVEMAGMVEHCDFIEQAQAEESRLRPDMIVHLAGGRNIVVDAKTPLLAYIESLETTDDAIRLEKLKQHAGQVRAHLDQLSTKSYWEQFSPTPELVVMFLEAESIFSAALQGDPALIEYGAQKRIVVATPTTLISLLRAIAYGWQQEQIAENAHLISELGRELYNRILTLGGHFTKVGAGLDNAVDAYNSAVGSLETRVLPGARKFKELGITSKEDIKELRTVDKTAREVSAEELLLTPPTE